MVSNIFQVLDEGHLKKLSKKDYNMSNIDYCRLCREKSNRTKFEKGSLNEETLEYDSIRIDNENFKEPPLKIKYAMKQMDNLEDDIITWNACKSNKSWYVNTSERNKRFFRNSGGEQEVYDYLDIIPFTPSVMINISPDWKESKLSMGRKVWILKNIINSYMEEQWYDKFEYVIENGSQGDHIHAHIVAHLNPACLKKTEGHLKRGNHTQQLMKYAKGIKGFQGCLKTQSIQKMILRNQELVDDKLDYLHEDKKPKGHKNKSVIEGGYVVGCL